MQNILLTIAIPTFNRAEWLKLCLSQLVPQLNDINREVEISIYDNASPDHTEAIVRSFLGDGLPLRYSRNTENIGSDRNIAQCFNEARGKYVLILGDDDLLIDGTLAWLISMLERKEYGVICLRPYGFDGDFRKEYPGLVGPEQEYTNGADFLVAIGQLVSLISSCVINKSILSNVDAKEFCGGNLVQVHLVIQAALLGPISLYTKNYYVACKRNNSGGYDFIKVFVEELSKIFDRYKYLGLTTENIYAFETHMLLGYFPNCLLRQRLTRTGDQVANINRLKERLGKRWLYHICLAPILYLPRPLAIVWGGVITVLGRVWYGDFRRGVYFLRNKFLLSSGTSKEVEK